ncbi:hypothetical protein [Bacillus sp. UMB0728]|uniref:hypothetical protein n=1 Tax=Bacillus sp. UMB0728 TaxID=2066052 RepID=UPI000C75CCAE|nr:hypothetical protein [Bacillus sp. UMB0728]PLR73509.1 hypothetical protein CYJ37_08180 [Bacillus sp. UMB0728]
MNKKHAIKVLSATAVAATAFVATSPADASVQSDAQKLVNQAKNAGTVLKWAISTEGSADGTTRPWAQYNAAKAARDKAVAAVNKLPASQKAGYLADLEANVNLHITRAMYYIDAITAGEKIKAKQDVLSAQIAKGAINDATETAYHELSKEIRKQAVLLDRVYGKSTRDEIRGQYKQAAEAVRDSALYAVTVKMELDLAADALENNKTADVEKHLAEANKYIGKVQNAAMKATLSKVIDEIEAQLTPAVKSVSAVNAKQLEVTFNQPVLGQDANVTNDATDAANYTLGGTPASSAVLSEDQRTVTVTFAGDVEGQDQVLVVNPVATTKKDANGAAVTTEKFSKVFSYTDTVKPQVTGTSYENGTIVVTFSEEIGTEPAVVRVNGVPVSADDYKISDSDATKIEITHTLAAGATASLYVAGAKDTSVAENEMSLYNGSVIAPSADASKPSITSVQVTGQNTATVTLSEAINQTNVTAKLQKGAAQSDVTLVKDTADTTGKTYTLTVDLNGDTAGDGIFSGNSTSETFTLYVAAGAMTDATANANELFSTSVTFNKDVTGPVLTTSNVTTDNKKFDFKFNENLTVAGSTADITVRNSEGVKIAADAETALKSGDTTVYQVDIKNGDVAFDAGTYTVTIPAGYFTDVYGNQSAAVTSTFTVGTPSNADTTKPVATVTNVVGTANAFQVAYGEEVTSSALNLGSYKLDGAALPAGTDIYFTSAAKTTVQIVLPENSINIGNQTTGASAILNVSGVADVAGNVVNSTNTAVTVKDNTAAAITNVQVIGQDVYVTFNEAVTVGEDVDANNAFNITVSNAVAEAGNLSAVAGNAKQVKFTLETAPATNPVVTVKAAQTVLTDANGYQVK